MSNTITNEYKGETRIFTEIGEDSEYVYISIVSA